MVQLDNWWSVCIILNIISGCHFTPGLIEAMGNVLGTFKFPTGLIHHLPMLPRSIGVELMQLSYWWHLAGGSPYRVAAERLLLRPTPPILRCLLWVMMFVEGWPVSWKHGCHFNAMVLFCKFPSPHGIEREAHQTKRRISRFKHLYINHVQLVITLAFSGMLFLYFCSIFDVSCTWESHQHDF